MVNKGRIHREIRKFMMFSLKLIKSDDKSMVEIDQIGEIEVQSRGRFPNV